MGPKRVIGAAERERRRVNQALYRARMRDNKEYKASEVIRTAVNNF